MRLIDDMKISLRLPLAMGLALCLAVGAGLFFVKRGGQH